MKLVDLIKENISKFSDITQETNPHNVFLYLKSLPNKFTLSTRWGDNSKLYDNGLQTALNNGPITRFYLNYLKNHNKQSKLLPIPEINSLELNPQPYDKINELIKTIVVYHSKIPQIDTAQPRSILSPSDNEQKDLNLGLFKAVCFQIMTGLLYEDYFGKNIFGRGSIHKIIEDIKLPENEDEFWKLYQFFQDKDNPKGIRTILFFSDSIPIIRTIEGK